MGNLDLILFISITVPLLMMLLVFRNQARTTMLFLVIGTFMCLMAGEVNALLLSLSGMTRAEAAVHLTPVVEELLKAFPIAFYTFLLRPNRQRLLECSVAVGVGFAILENACIFAGEYGTVTLTEALIRGFGAGLMHCICTLLVGFSLSYVLLRRKLFYTGCFATLSAAIIFHSVYNMLIQSNFLLLGALLPTLIFVPLLLLIEKMRKKVSHT